MKKIREIQVAAKTETGRKIYLMSNGQFEIDGCSHLVTGLREACKHARELDGIDAMEREVKKAGLA